MSRLLINAPRHLASYHARLLSRVFYYASTTRRLCSKQSHPFTHLDQKGRASMVDVGNKVPTRRTAIAAASVLLGPSVYAQLERSMSSATSQKNQVVGAKGDVFGVSRIAAIMAAKRTAELIPLCHPVVLNHVGVELALNEELKAVDITASATTEHAPTGVEMEAMTAASVAALTVYDMCKAASKAIVISNVRLLEKSGGKSGHYRRESSE